MLKLIICISALGLASKAVAENQAETELWRVSEAFVPFDLEADGIGPISFSFQAAQPSINFAAEKFDLQLEGPSRVQGNWRPQTPLSVKAEVFRVIGATDNQIELLGCDKGNKQSIFASLSETTNRIGDMRLLALSFFQSRDAPTHELSEGKCSESKFEVASGAEQDHWEPLNPIQSWTTNTNTNPLDDSKTVTLTLDATSGTSRPGRPVKFIARCKSNKTEAYAVWGDYLGDDSRDVYESWKQVIVRVGDGQSREERWGLSTSGDTTFAPSWAGDFLKELLDEERLILQTVPYGQNPNTAIFDISGLRNVLGELSSTCNWSF